MFTENKKVKVEELSWSLSDVVCTYILSNSTLSLNHHNVFQIIPKAHIPLPLFVAALVTLYPVGILSMHIQMLILRGDNWMHYANLFSIRVKELFEPIVLSKRKTGFCIF